MFSKAISFFYLILLVSFSFGQKDTIKQVYYYPDSQISSEGQMVNGKPVGYWKVYYPWGILKSEGSRKNYQLEGSCEIL